MQVNWHSLTDDEAEPAELTALDNLARKATVMEAAQATARYSGENDEPLVSITFVDICTAHVGFIVRNPGQADETVVVVQKIAAFR